MTLIDTTERQTSEDVVAFSGGRLCYPLWVFGGRMPLHLTRSR